MPPPVPRQGLIVREMVFGGVRLRIEHDGNEVVLVLPDGEHLIGSWREASQLAADLMLTSCGRTGP